MLVEVDSNTYYENFQKKVNPFVSSGFIELNKGKVDKVLRLVEDCDKPEMGIVLGLKGETLLSPFSAPFGGFHFKKENIYADKVDGFIMSLKEFFYSEKYKELRITLPPDLYSTSINAKCVNSLFRKGFVNEIPEITSWIDLQSFSGMYRQKNSKEYYRQALRNKLRFSEICRQDDELLAYELIKENRAKFNRPIYMTFDDLIKMRELWPVDFFKVTSDNGTMLASAIFYRCHPTIIYPVYWGDNDEGRPLRCMDFMLLNLWTYYKEKGYWYVDLGISTEQSIPNSGLLRFKETHEANSSLRHKFYLQ